ncbi:MAG: BON domain-containing protein [Pseudomonadota bacterium]
MRPLHSLSALATAMLVLSGCVAAPLIGAGVEATRAVTEERSTGQQLKDTEIQLTLNDKFIKHSARLFGDVSTTVIEGRVLLTGSVANREDKIAATQLTWETPGVTEVTDELTVARDSGARAYAEDAWISNQLRVQLLADSAIASQNYNVETVDKVVHVTGLARSGAELGRVLDRASGVPGVARVVSHVLTIDDPRRIAAQTPQQTGG